MPGTFSKSARPLLPGAYFNWVAQQQSVVPPSVGAIVCVPFTSDWGPSKQATLVESFQDYLAVFGGTVGTPGYIAVWQAFQGEGGVGGRYGAGAVLCYRMGGSSEASASHAFTNTTPATALTVSAKYPGTFGNKLTVTVQDHVADATKDELVVLNGTTVLETWVYTDADIVGLAAAINNGSNWISAVEAVTGVALTHVTAQALSGGDDGTTTTGTDWTALESALETQAFGILAPYGLTDSTIIAALKTWAAGPSSGTVGRNALGQRFSVVLGGLTDETATTAVTAAGTLADGNFCRIGMSHFTDANLLDVNGKPTVLSSTQFAPRVAGALAGRGEGMSLTYARFAGVTLQSGPTSTDIANCLNGGVMVFGQDSDATAPVFLVSARTTFTAGGPNGSSSLPGFPYLVYRNPKFMRTMQNVETEWTQWANSTIIGLLPVNNKTRDSAIAEMQSRLRARQLANVIQSGWTVSVDQNPPVSDDDEFIALSVGIKFGRSVEQVFFTVGVG